MARKYYTKEECERAHNVDLANFLLQTDPEHYIVRGDSVRLIDPEADWREKRIKAISVKLGSSWFHDFKTDTSGSAVDYLVDYMGYSEVEAILALAGSKSVEYKQGFSRPEIEEIEPIVLPEKKEGRPKQMYAYLMNRGIPADVIKRFEEVELLYQSEDYNNIVFINRERDFAEIRGTYTYGEPYHGVAKNSRPDSYWAFNVGDPKQAFICESAIDAISLWLLRRKEGNGSDAKYVSIAGVGNQKKIERVKDEMIQVTMAVDNDDAGAVCRSNNYDCDFILPVHKDWNEDLLSGEDGD